MSVKYGIKPLSEVCSITGGGTPSKSKEEYYHDGDILWATVRDMNVDVLYDTENKITKLGLDKSSSNIVPAGNVVIATRVGLGKVCLLNFDTAINQDLKGIIPKHDNVSSKYLFWWFKSISNKLLAAGTGATVQGVKLTFINSLPFPHFLLEEQKKIVTILDKTFAAIDQAQANIQQNIQNAQDLFQSKLNQIFSQQGEGWEEKTLDDVCMLIGGGTPSKSKKEFYGGDIPWATVGDMKSELLSSTELKITTEGLEKSSSKIVPKGSVVIATRVGLGKVCLLMQDTAINQDLKGVVQRNHKEIKNEYIFWWFKSVTNKIIQAGTGATVQGVKLPFVKSLSFPVVSSDQQQEIIDRLNLLRVKTDNLIVNNNQKIESLEELKKSLLQKAFSGELTQEKQVA